MEMPICYTKVRLHKLHDKLIQIFVGLRNVVSHTGFMHDEQFLKKQVSMTRKWRKHRQQTKAWHHEEETLKSNSHMTARTQLK